MKTSFYSDELCLSIELFEDGNCIIVVQEGAPQNYPYDLNGIYELQQTSTKLVGFLEWNRFFQGSGFMTAFSGTIHSHETNDSVLLLEWITTVNERDGLKLVSSGSRQLTNHPRDIKLSPPAERRALFFPGQAMVADETFDQVIKSAI